jgi:hypothetical protein
MQVHSQQKQPSLKAKTWPKQLLGSLPLAFCFGRSARMVETEPILEKKNKNFNTFKNYKFSFLTKF